MSFELTTHVGLWAATASPADALLPLIVEVRTVDAAVLITLSVSGRRKELRRPREELVSSALDRLRRTFHKSLRCAGADDRTLCGHPHRRRRRDAPGP